jgi:hypothetical protein
MKPDHEYTLSIMIIHEVSNSRRNSYELQQEQMLDALLMTTVDNYVDSRFLSMCDAQ